jgi:hypothetical protein
MHQPNNGVSSPCSSPLVLLLGRSIRRNHDQSPPCLGEGSESPPSCGLERRGELGAMSGVVAVSAGKESVSVVGAAVMSL